MSAPQKLRGGPASELTKLKAAWLKLSPDAQAFWSELFSSSTTQADIRKQLLAKLKINLRFDKQLTEFRSWTDAQSQRELMAEKIEERKAELLADGKTLEEAQGVLLAEASAYSVASRDFKLGMKVSSEISKTTAQKFDEQKFRFDAVAACRKQLPSLKAIESNKTLSEAEKTASFMEKLFGTKPQ